MPALHRAARNPYNAEHRRIRRQLLPDAIGTPCPGDHINGHPYRSRNCDRIMTNPRRMHLAHTTPIALGGQHADHMCCAPCNLGAGAILGNQLRNIRKPPRLTRRSRTW